MFVLSQAAYSLSVVGANLALPVEEPVVPQAVLDSALSGAQHFLQTPSVQSLRRHVFEPAADAFARVRRALGLPMLMSMSGDDSPQRGGAICRRPTQVAGGPQHQDDDFDARIDVHVPVPTDRTVPKFHVWTAYRRIDSTSADPKEKTFLKSVADNIFHVRHAEFMDALHKTVDQLNAHLGQEEDCVVLWDTTPHKSKRWVYQLAAKWLKRKPFEANYFTTNIRRDVRLIRTMRERGINKIVIFDDASYSGDQLWGLLKTLSERCRAQGFFPEVIVAVPCISEAAENEMRTSEYPNIKFIRAHRMSTLDSRLKRREPSLPGLFVIFDHNVPDNFSNGAYGTLDWMRISSLLIDQSSFEAPYKIENDPYFLRETDGFRRYLASH